MVKKGVEVCVLVKCHRGWEDLELPGACGDVSETGISEKPEPQARL